MRRQHVRNLNSNDVSNQMKGHCRKWGDLSRMLSRHCEVLSCITRETRGQDRGNEE